MADKRLTYRDSGVDIDEGDALVERIKPLARRTMRPEVLAGIGGFGGLFEVPKGYREPVLVVGTDGVGTKLKLAFLAGCHDTVGIDLVAMSVNDVVVCGAEPVVFLDYFATSRLDANEAEQVIRGIAEGCLRAGCALIGGGTGGLPRVSAPGAGDPPGVLPAGPGAALRRGWGPAPPIFARIQQAGNLEDAEMLRTFNMGIGMCAIVSRADLPRALGLLAKRGQAAFEIGAVESAPGLAEPEVVVA